MVVDPGCTVKGWGRLILRMIDNDNETLLVFTPKLGN